jgi:hypothetical protein
MTVARVRISWPVTRVPILTEIIRQHRGHRDLSSRYPWLFAFAAEAETVQQAEQDQ